MFKSIYFVGLVSLVFVSICSADPVTINSSSYTVTGYANVPSMPTSYSLTDSSPVSSSTSVIGGYLGDGYAGSSASNLYLQTYAYAELDATSGATASTLITFQPPSDLLVVDAYFAYFIHLGTLGTISASYTLTDLNTSAVVGTRTFKAPVFVVPPPMNQSATDDFLIDPTHIYSLSMFLNDRGDDLGNRGSFYLALNPPVAPLPSALPMGLALAALIAVASAFAGRAKGRAKVS